ncbi:MAG: TIGR04283 family arsenosugar biosynthesis glycosyltransferase [Verrucomicrobiales bacterium]|nr:TIGR04283 family arsenosugar biosynthesis glycosyltransferase [Verrucomicrobiales bacterium]
MFAVSVLSLSVILPTLNEADTIASTLHSLESVASISVVDGGSTDETLAHIAPGQASVIRCEEPGRARQMNRGAAESEGELLLFLHADTRVPAEALERMQREMSDRPELVGGGFLRRFDSDSLFLRMTCRLADWRSRRLGLFLGDQGIFVRRSVFETMGGFDETMTVGEDLDFSYRMTRLGPTLAAAPPVRSSARRFEEKGAIRQTWEDYRTARNLLREIRQKEEA